MFPQNITHVVSFSGGRTSAYLVHLMEEKRKNDGWNVKYIFMDTGAEHPETYTFIRNVVNHFGIKLVCLRCKIDMRSGHGTTYRQVSLDDIKPDLQPWKDMMSKYGTPYFGGAFCSRTMKTDAYKAYCKDNFGAGNYISWLGIRYDEPVRLWGEDAAKTLRKYGVEDLTGFYLECRDLAEKSGDLSGLISQKISSMFGDTVKSHVELITKRITANIKEKTHYMAEISEFEKQDVLDWWGKQSFDLGIPEHLGNCMFCIKKGLNKVALAAKDEPLFKSEFLSAITDDSVKVITTRKHDPLVMYRSSTTFEQVIHMFSDTERDDLFFSLKGNKRFETGSCTEACEPLVCSLDDDQLDLFGFQAA